MLLEAPTDDIEFEAADGSPAFAPLPEPERGSPPENPGVGDAPSPGSDKVTTPSNPARQFKVMEKFGSIPGNRGFPLAFLLPPLLSSPLPFGVPVSLPLELPLPFPLLLLLLTLLRSELSSSGQESGADGADGAEPDCGA